MCRWRRGGRIPVGGHHTASGSWLACMGVSERWPCKERKRGTEGVYGLGERRWNVTKGPEILG